MKTCFNSFEMGATWVFIFDGCAFLTNQSFNSISNFVRNQSRPEFIHFNPMVRLQHKVNVSNNLTYENLFPYISGQQECQVAVHRKFVNLRSKISLMKSQKGRLDHTFITIRNCFFCSMRKPFNFIVVCVCVNQLIRVFTLNISE